jgi:hypothetical protein
MDPPILRVLLTTLVQFLDPPILHVLLTTLVQFSGADVSVRKLRRAYVPVTYVSETLKRNVSVLRFHLLHFTTLNDDDKLIILLYLLLIATSENKQCWHYASLLSSLDPHLI